MSINCIIVDDEKLARRRLSKLIEKRMELDVLVECKTGQQAIIDIENLEPDVIFLDIELKDMTGFEVLSQVSHKPIVVFVTAYREYAVKAFDVFAFDYLLKPFNKKRFDVAVDRIISFCKKQNKNNDESRINNLMKYFEMLNTNSSKLTYTKPLAVRSGNETILVNYQDVMYIKASGNYVEVFTKERKYLARTSLSNLLDTDHNFLIRIHRSTAINIHFVVGIINSEYSDIDVRMNDNELLRVSKSYRNKVKVMFGL